MPHRFVVRVAGCLEIYDRFKDIPEEIEHVIEFRPEVPPPPHTDAQHEEIDSWNSRLQELIRRERRASSDPSR